MTLTSDLVSRIGIESCASLPYSLMYESQICCVAASWVNGVSCGSFCVTVTLNS